MTIAVNGIYLKHNATGVANHLIKTVNVWASWTGVRVIIYCNTEIADSCAKRLNERIEIKILPLPFLKSNSTIWFLLKFGKIVNNTRPDLLWCPAPWVPLCLSKEQKVLVSIHDFVSKDFRSTMRPVNRIVSDSIEKYSINRANYFWAISNYTRDRLYEYYPNSCNRPLYVGSGTDDGIKDRSICSNSERKDLNETLGIKEPYMLFVGTLEPRKNLKYLLSIYPALLKTSKLELVIVGARGWGKTDIKDIVEKQGYPKEHIVFTGYVTDEQLAKLYSGAQLFISTSLNEGFGLPQIEAMSCGCPVVTAKNSAMIEVSEGAGVLVEGYEESSWVNGVSFAIEHRREIISLQNKRVKKYSWSNVMEELRIFLEKIGACPAPLKDLDASCEISKD